jgi:hypothetical protein
MQQAAVLGVVLGAPMSTIVAPLQVLLSKPLVNLSFQLLAVGHTAERC